MYEWHLSTLPSPPSVRFPWWLLQEYMEKIVKKMHEEIKKEYKADEKLRRFYYPLVMGICLRDFYWRQPTRYGKNFVGMWYQTYPCYFLSFNNLNGLLWYRWPIYRWPFCFPGDFPVNLLSPVACTELFCRIDVATYM